MIKYVWDNMLWGVGYDRKEIEIIRYIEVDIYYYDFCIDNIVS